MVSAWLASLQRRFSRERGMVRRQERGAVALRAREFGDFTANAHLLWLALLAIVVGLVCAVIALVLLDLIGFFTNLFFYQRFSFAFVSPAATRLGWLVLFVPAFGGLIIGLMARYGSERIRGHGIPEAMEAILIGQSRIQPRVAILKPLSSAISIGSGGPFGAEGPIIMTGGAFGSIMGQLLHLTAAERKALLVAGAAGGMSATFGTPVAAVLLAVELLLFEWKPRSLIPVAAASAAAAMLRSALLGGGALFPMPTHPSLSLSALLFCPVVGIVAGCGSYILTVAVYAAEDLFRRLPFHWMWWPVLGGLVVGLGGWLFPEVLGVGYDNIRALIAGNITVRLLLAVLLVKAVIWAISLGSGTSGGVLAPLLMMGAALGGLEATLLPLGSPGVWALVSMAAILGGTMRSPLTGVVFALELTHQVNLLLPLLIASVAAYAFTVLTLRRSILTEKVARRGHHVAREYAVDPLEVMTVGRVMTREPVTLPGALTLREARQRLFGPDGHPKHQGYPVVDAAGKLIGIVTRSDLAPFPPPEEAEQRTLAEVMGRKLVVAYPDEPLRLATNRMLAANVGRLPIVAREAPDRLVGMVTRSDVLKAQLWVLEEEQQRQRLLVLALKTGLRRRPPSDLQPIEREAIEALAVEPVQERDSQQTLSG